MTLTGADGRAGWNAIWTEIVFSPEQAIAAHGLTGEERVLPVLCRIRHTDLSAGWREKRQCSLTAAELVSNALLRDSPHGGLVWLEESRILLVCADQALAGPQEAADRCASVCEACAARGQYELCFSVGEEIATAKLATAVDGLYALDRSNVDDCPVERLGMAGQSVSAAAVDMKDWTFLLSEERFDDFLCEVSDYFLGENRARRFSRALLQQFNQDFAQSLYAVMREKCVPAHLLFSDEKSSALCRRAPLSVSGTLEWVFWAVTEFSRYLEKQRRDQDYIENTKSYIRSHLSEDLSRQDLADNVHLSQNHLARLFKRETGVSIADFILSERMKLAMELLQHTTLPVGEVALRVGYENYSYFLNLFRRMTGLRPSEYRQRGQQDAKGATEQ